jgi:hypothetical protein
MSIKRKLPNSNLGRQNALYLAFGKQATISPGNEVLHPQTATRLTTEGPQYNTALSDVALAQSNLSTHTPLKVVGITNCRTYVSHFIQVFNLGVARGKYLAGHRSLYMLPVDSSALPTMTTDTETVLWAHRIITGDSARITAGGAPMANPDTMEVITASSNANSYFLAQNALSETLKARQQAVDDINPDADKLILRIWDEVEAYYGEDDAEGTRAHARLWGVVYVTEGPAAILTGLVRDALGNPRIGAEVIVVETGAKAITNAEGRYNLPTTVIGTATVQASYPDTTPATTTVTIADHAEEVTIAVGDLVVG